MDLDLEKTKHPAEQYGGGEEQKNCGGGGDEEEFGDGGDDFIDAGGEEENAGAKQYGGGEAEKEHCDNDATEDLGDTDDAGEYYYNSEDEEQYVVEYRWLPYGHYAPRPLCNSRGNYTVEQAQEISEDVSIRNMEQLQEWCEMCNMNLTPLSTRPLQVLPDITTTCVTGYLCYHRRYWTDIVSPTVPTHTCFRPCEMMQVFSLRLSSTQLFPVDIYGHFAIRDACEPRHNYLFNRSRDDPATITPGCSFLPLCSPCRGIYVLQCILLDVDLWIKEGDESTAKRLFCGYIELNASFSGFDTKLRGRIPGGLDMCYAFFSDSIESVVEIFAEAKTSSEVKISAFTSSYDDDDDDDDDDEILLYDGTFIGSGTIVNHCVAVRLLGELHILSKLNDSLYSWTFQPRFGVIEAPEHPVSDLAQFTVGVSFRTKGEAAATWQWSCDCSGVQLMETRL